LPAFLAFAHDLRESGRNPFFIHKPKNPEERVLKMVAADVRRRILVWDMAEITASLPRRLRVLNPT